MYDILDTIIKGSDNPVSIIVAGFDLTTASDIEVVFGSETYTLLLDANVVRVVNATELELSLGATLEEAPSYFDIKVFTTTYPRPEGFTITNRCLGNLDRPKICG